MQRKTALICVASSVVLLACSEQSGMSGATPKRKDPESKVVDSGDRNSEDANAEDLGNSAKGNDDSGNDSRNGKSDDSIEDIKIADQEGRTVLACFSYDSNKMQALIAAGQAQHGHWCNRAIFNVFSAGSNLGQINLNNRTEGFGSGGPGFGAGGFDGPSVLGGKVKGKWTNGRFEVETRCVLPDCHQDVGFLSLIGEVIMPNGKRKYLKIDQGQIYPQRKYEYKFDEFELIDEKPSFGPYCELK